MTIEEPCFTIIAPSKGEQITEQQLKTDIEKGDDNMRIKCLKEVIKGLLAGYKYPSILMFVIRFILPRKSHTLKKLLLIYFEIVPKRSEDGKLLPQMILVCDAYRRDLEHPNEYIRGATLRFLCKLQESDLLEPLMPTICANLEHKHSYVRRNAVLCIYTIYRKFQFLMPDAPEIIFNYLENEKDMSCKRNAFMMLTYADQERALEYVTSRLDDVPNFGDIVQLMVVELVYKVCRTNPAERSHFIRTIYQLLSAQSPAVRFEASKTLLALTTAPTAVTAALKSFLELVYKESDNNIKLVVLGQVDVVRVNPATSKVVEDQIMDLLRCLSSPDLEVRKKVLEIAEGSISSKNVMDVVTILRKELAKTHDEIEFNDGYRQALVKSLHNCAVKFPTVAVQIVPLLMDFLGESHSSADDVVSSVREAMEFFPELRNNIIEKLLESFDYIKAPSVFRTCLWILGEYCSSASEIDGVFEAIHDAIGELPLVSNEMKVAGEGEEEEEEKPKETLATARKSSYTKVNSDGSYATQSAFTTNTPANASNSLTATSTTPLRQLLLDGEYFVGAVLSSTLVKLVLHRQEFAPGDSLNNKRSAEAMLIMASILHLGKSGLNSNLIDDDSYERIMLCLRVLSEPNEVVNKVFITECRTSLGNLLREMQREAQALEEKARGDNKIQVDDAILFRHLGKVDEQEDELATSLSVATGDIEKKDLSSSLNKVFQLTGFSDPVYAEAYVNVNQYDIVLDVLVVNQTEDTLQNLSLELSTMGDLKLVERPQTYTLAPNSFITIKTNVKVSSSETGIIFGSIVYDVSGTTTTSCVVLNDIHIDIIDYILPATCGDKEFRAMWIEFEWENKVTVNTDITSLEEYTKHIVDCTNMNCLTLESSRGGECDFYAAKLYARSIFGEDALASLSIEKDSQGKVVGHIRIRAKTQGIALSLGDKITLHQRKRKAGSLAVI